MELWFRILTWRDLLCRFLRQLWTLDPQLPAKNRPNLVDKVYVLVGVRVEILTWRDLLSQLSQLP